MIIKRKLLPGAPGTKKLVEKYGDRLLCVRYRYDAAKGRRLTTVKLIEEEQAWQPNGTRIPANKIVKVKVAYGEIELGRALRQLGGTWNRAEKVWEIPYKHVVQLGLKERMVPENLSNMRQTSTKKPP